MTIEHQASGWIAATCDACRDDLTGMVWEDIQDLADDAHGFGGLVHIQMWNELGTTLVLCRACHHGYLSTLAEVEADRFSDGEVFAIWAGKGWATRALRSQPDHCPKCGCDEASGYVCPEPPCPLDAPAPRAKGEPDG